MFVGDVHDRLSIRELIDRYSDAVMRRDVADWAATWDEDATWIFRGTSIVGRDAIVATWTHAMATFGGVLFMAVPGSIAVDGDRATALTHTLEHLESLDGTARMQAGQYRDRLIRRADGWRFVERSFTPRPLVMPGG